MEIGSIFEIDLETLFDQPIEKEIVLPFARNKELYSTLFNSGRAAIEAIVTYLKNTGCRRVWLPSFCCSSVRDAVERAGMPVALYAVEPTLEIAEKTILELPLKPGDIFYYVHYFGLFPSRPIICLLNKLKTEGVVMIEDITLSALSKDDTAIGFGDYVVASLRKWLPATDGAQLLSPHRLPCFDLKSAASDFTLYYFAAQVMKSRYLANPNVDKDVFLHYSGMGIDSLFEDYTIRKISKVAENILLATDFDAICQKRICNYDYLYKGLLKLGVVDIPGFREPGAVPMGLFLLTDNRDAFVKYLIQKGIYCNIHWRPNDMSVMHDGSQYLSEHCVTIPCDQRYSQEHMEYIIAQVKSFFGGTES